MTIFVLQTVERSADGGKSVRVSNRWPYEASDLNEAMVFIDKTPAFSGWGKVDRFEILDSESRLLASRPFDESAAWTEAPIKAESETP